MSVNFHFEMEDDFIEDFLTTRCEIDDNVKDSFRNIHYSFIDYCRGKVPDKYLPSMRYFSFELQKRFRREHDGRIFVFHGLRVREKPPLPGGLRVEPCEYLCEVSTMATMVRGSQKKGAAGSGQTGRGFAAAASTMRGFSGRL